jgi:hypothetical protein
VASIDDLLKGESAKGLAIGIAAAVLVPVVLPALAAVARPLARAAIKSGIVMYEKGREAVAEMGEVVEDLVAEARAELDANHAASAAAAAAAAGVDDEATAGEQEPREEP